MRQLNVGKGIVTFFFKKGHKYKSITSTMVGGTILYVNGRHNSLVAANNATVEEVMRDSTKDGYVEADGKYFLLHLFDRIEARIIPWYLEVN